MASEEKNYINPGADAIIKCIGSGAYGKVLLDRYDCKILEYKPESASRVDDTIHEILVIIKNILFFTMFNDVCK